MTVATSADGSAAKRPAAAPMGKPKRANVRSVVEVRSSSAGGERANNGGEADEVRSATAATVDAGAAMTLLAARLSA